ncbi:MAG: chemotaxis-specific protein-glutamate methyltransferase CheB [Deltaproteobacteria bacterium]|nr:chemotaxis-specific protein-glutamate methyltransferase CheB [Deltaproteobacteria bacterium]
MTETKGGKRTVRVLVVDDSPLARQIVRAVLSADPDIEVVGMAAGGQEGIDLVLRLRPDIVTMDLRMPGLDGLAATAEIMRRCPTPVLIVTASSFWQRQHEVFASFKYGVLDVLEKPSAPSDAAFSAAGRILVEKVKILSRVKVALLAPAPSWHRPSRRRASPVRGRRRAIGIGASTGGPRVLLDLLRDIPAELAAPVFVAQHMSEGFVEGFAKWLSAEARRSVLVAQDGALPEAGQVWLAPGNKNMVLVPPGVIHLDDGPAPAGIRPSVDALLASLAATYGAGAVGVVLTGIGKDGSQGVLAVKQAGGVTLVQDEASSVVYGMPSAAVQTGAVDEVVPLERLASRLTELVGLVRRDGETEEAGDGPPVKGPARPEQA